MTVWVLHQDLSEEEESKILESEDLALPFQGMPDLSTLGHVQECQTMLRLLHPDDTPEAIALRLDRIWKLYQSLELEDLILVPLPLTNKLAIGTITNKYHYHVGDLGEDQHCISVEWYEKLEKLNSFGKCQYIFERTISDMTRVTHELALKAIHERLPHSYNRWVRWKWIWAFIFLLAGVRLLRLSGM